MPTFPCECSDCACTRHTARTSANSAERFLCAWCSKNEHMEFGTLQEAYGISDASEEAEVTIYGTRDEYGGL